MIVGRLRIGNLPARAQSEPAENRAYVTLDGVLANLQRNRDLAVARTAPDQMGDLLFTLGQRRAGRPASLATLRRGRL